MNNKNRISSDPRICGGQDCITGTRIPAAQILELIKAGQSEPEIIRNYPGITLEDLAAVREWGKKR